MFDNPAKLLTKLNVNAMRPFVNNDGRTYVINDGKAQLHTNDGLLMYDEWKDLDRNVIQVASERLVGIADLKVGRLTHNLGSIGVTIAQWETASDITDADFSMSGVTSGEKDTQAFGNDFVPVPIIHKDFSLNIRRLEASRRFGTALDSSISTIAARKVAEASEDMLFAGAPIVVDGQRIYGYTNSPKRGKVKMTSDWAGNGVTGADILGEVMLALEEARGNRYFGPYTLYIPGEYETKFDNDFKTTGNDNRTIRERLLALNGIANIKVADRLEAGNVVLVQLTSDVVDLAIAQEISTVQWESKGGMTQDFKVMAVWVPRLKSDYDGRSGFVHIGTGNS